VKLRHTGLQVWRDNLDENGAAIRMRIGDRSDMTNTLSLGRCEAFLMVPYCDCRVSIATRPSKLKVQPRPPYSESDGRPPKVAPRYGRKLSNSNAEAALQS
jgi:hypothetical protein